jgi:hypothetical protein
VSLVAVFLALGMGTLVGSSFISRGTVAVLKASQRRLDASNKQLLAELRDLKDDRDGLGELVESTEDWVLQGRLQGRAVVVLGTETVPDELAAIVTDALLRAGARVEGSVQLSPKLDLTTQAKRNEVAAALGAPSADAAALADVVVEGLTAALSGRSTGMVRRLVDAGLATVRDVPDAQAKPLEALASPGSLVVLVAGPGRSRADPDDRIAGDLARSLSTLDGTPIVVAAAEPGEGPFHLVGRLREADLRLVTVDGVETPRGRMALVLGLQAASSGRFGDYGRGPGASSLLPLPN